jgi:hypothetical protein
MNVPIRMLGLATTIFWIILVGFIASAAFSLKDLNFGVGNPQLTAGSNHDLILTLPLYIDNRGYYSLKGFNLTTVFSDAEGAEVSKSSTVVPVIPQGRNVTVLHNATLNVDSMAKQNSQYIFDDCNLTCTVMAGLNFAELLPTQLAANIPFPWGAPFYDFKLGQPRYSRVDSSHSMARVPLSFENHAAFDVTGNITVKLYDGQDTLLGESQKAITVSKYSSYKDNLDFSVPSASLVSSTNLSGYFEVYFSTNMFDCGPVVIPYG